MTDLLTKEEREEVEGVRHRWQHERSDSVDTGKLLAIIDNLSRRGVKKYSEEELRAAFRAMIQRNVIMLTAEQTTMVEAGWLDCARFLGALEEK